MLKVLIFKWMAWLFLATSILSIVYTYSRGGLTTGPHFKYYIISLAGILFWGVVLKLGDNIRAKIVMVTTSLVVGLYLVESILCFSGFGRISKPQVSVERGIEFDARSTKFEVIRELRNGGVDAVPSLQAYNLIDNGGPYEAGTLLPFGGISKKTTVFCNECGEYAIYLADRYGFSNPDLEWDQAQTEWLLTGDSFAHGACVQPDSDIAGQIRSMTGKSVINLGIWRNGPLIELAVLKEYAESIRPQNVLWIYFEGNDLLGLQHEKLSPLLMNYLQPDFSQNLIHRQEEIDSILVKHVAVEAILLETRWLRLFHIRKLIKIDAQIIAVDIYSTIDMYIDPLFSKILTKARNRIKAWGGKLYFVYLPTFDRYTNANYDHNLYKKRSEVISVVKELDIPVIDIHQEVFADHPDPLSLFPLRVYGHYNTDGYREVAKAIIAGVSDWQKRSSTLYIDSAGGNSTGN